MSRIETDVAALFQPLQVRGLTLPNRIVMAPMTRNFSIGGVPGPDVAAYYKRRAEGEVGLIITEGTGVDHPSAIGEGGLGKRQSDIPLMYGEASLSGWRRVVDGVHAAGGLIVPQLWHMGVYRLPGTGPHSDAESIRPSGLWGPRGGHTSSSPEFIAKVIEPTAPPSDETIQDVVDAFSRSAHAAMSIGFDGIAVHGAHGYLIDTFFWHATNRRTGRWGGGIRARVEFAYQIVRALRRAGGPDKPVIFRYSQFKAQDYAARIANTPEELRQFLEPLAEAGVDVFDVSARHFDRPAFDDSTLSLAGWTKKLTHRTTMAVGGIGLTRDGEIVTDYNLHRVVARFENGEFDLIAVGRSLLNDANWVRKVRNGEPFLPFTTAAFDTLI